MSFFKKKDSTTSRPGSSVKKESTSGSVGGDGYDGPDSEGKRGERCCYLDDLLYSVVASLQHHRLSRRPLGVYQVPFSFAFWA
jgi:hypothetical protein